MPKFKLVVNNQAISTKTKKLRLTLTDFYYLFLQKMSEQIVLNSPVDTGAYMDSHNINGGPGYSSKGRPRGQAFGQYGQEAVNRLYGQIASLPEGSDAYMVNNAPHASAVEYQHGYAPYTTARLMAQALAAEAEREAKARNL